MLFIYLELASRLKFLKKGGVAMRKWIIVLGLFLVTLAAAQGSLAQKGGSPDKQECSPPPCAFETQDVR